MTTTTFKAIFEIVEQIHCPLYEREDLLTLTDKTFSCPDGKEVCLILVRDMTQILFLMLNEQVADESESRLLSCSGCTGLIKFQKKDMDALSSENDGRAVVAGLESAMQEICGRVVESAFLRAIPPERLSETLSKFHEITVPQDTQLIRQGEPNQNLYVVLAGTFDVENSDKVIATLHEGDLFGEMSYLTHGRAVATVRAQQDTLVLAISADDFGALLGKVSSVQVFMAKLLADRLQRISAARAQDLESCMSGRLDEVLPAELFQVFHMHQKTGVLLMHLLFGEARVSFREGCIINAQYGANVSEEAIFAILAEKKGTYRFTSGLHPQEMKAAEIGDFMSLLMEGVKRVDEGGN